VDILLAALGCLLGAVGLMMAANRSGYVTFIVGPRTVLLLAGVAGVVGVVGVFGYWVLRGSH
jgi:hypothetical protein